MKICKDSEIYGKYVDESLGIFEVDSDQGDTQFADMGANMQEGVSFVKNIDTSYESNSVATVKNPKSHTPNGDAVHTNRAPIDCARGAYPVRMA